jgi:NagD protein
MDTDIVAGVEAAVDTALMLSGVTKREDLCRFAYRPAYIFSGLDELVRSLLTNE